jgi:hypothetical protein
MLSGNELYVVLKLVSGEQVMAILREEDDDRVLLETPMCIRTIPNLEMAREHVTAHPLCQFSDDKIYVIHKKDIMFCKKLHQVFIPHYMRIVAESAKTSLLSKEKTEPLWEEDEGEMTVEEARKRIEMLRSLAGMEEDEEQQPSPKSLFVEGNDTIN